MISIQNDYGNFTTGKRIDPKYVYVDFDPEFQPKCFDQTGQVDLTIVYSKQELQQYIDDGANPMDLLDLSGELIEKAYMMRTDGYRGTLVYTAFVKVNGKWYDCDVVGEGKGYEIVSGFEDLENGNVENLIELID